ncbi:DUF1643 domain-containing protein [Caryophanon tenue]|uniref:DUF1643 domain-containing protein n=1 Tax=Caryophanon tenue TaxID=33978 RepID=A0A1C0Y4X0_9BACL|nr:DUF1643 domain-containing protein [Caryophanon tenue]OCS82247.1 hypothetical protein A6M13_07370 [Caryophanon tenue]
MILQFNTSVEFDDQITKEEFEEELREWLSSKGHNVLQTQLSTLPSQPLSPFQLGSNTAVFHSQYDPNDTTNRTTYKRYFLSRCWDSKLPIMTFFGMNPSNASTCSNDPTVEFMIQMAKYNDCGSLYVVNSSPYIKSKGTSKEDFVIDDESYKYIQFAIEQSEFVILAWGKNGQKWGIPTLLQKYPLRTLFSKNIYKLKVIDFGRPNTKETFPKHPLQIKDKFIPSHGLLPLNQKQFKILFPISN